MKRLPYRFRELGGPIIEQWSIHVRTPGKWYKLLVNDPHSGRLLLFICSAKRQMLTALLVCPHNISKCAIDSTPAVTSLRLQLDTTGEVYTAVARPATTLDIETYTKCWPNLKALLIPPKH